MIALLCYLFYFASASASPLQRRWLAKRRTQEEQIRLAFLVQLFVAIAGFSLLLIHPFSLANKPLAIATLAMACSVFGALFLALSYWSQKHVDAGVTTLISNVYTPVTILVATIFLNESLSLKQLLGTTILLVSVVLVSKKHRIGRFSFDKYFLAMLASGVMLGLLLSCERALMKTTGFTAGTLVSWWSQALGMLILIIIVRPKGKFRPNDVLSTGILRYLQSLSWVILLQIVGNLSVVSAVTTFKVVVVFIAAALILKEREDLSRKVFGSLIAIGGLLLMK